MKTKIFFSILIVLFPWLLSYSQTDTIYRNLTVVQADSLITAYSTNPDFVIIDVRTASDFATSHIQNAINMDFYGSTFYADIAALDHSRAYLLYCFGGSRSGITFTTMQTYNFKEVYNMLGGISAWISAGYPVVTGTTDLEASAENTTILFYPNPAVDIIHINSCDQIYKTCSISNSAGQQILQTKLLYPDPSIDVSGFANGLYFITLSDGSSYYQSKVFICK